MVYESESCRNITSAEDRGRASSVVVEHLRAAIVQAMKSSETAELVALICDNNGLTVEEFLQAPHEFTEMELFLLATPQLPQLRLFPYLTVVKVMHVGLESMEPFSPLHHIEELWLCDNNITVIEGVRQMRSLKYLYLQGNLIESMDGIPSLPNLERLWLCRNRLQNIRKLDLLPQLRSLWVASNRITSLEGAFDSSMTALEELNLSNNQIYFFGQIKNLSVLKSLRVLWLSDPMYGDAPIYHLSNYTTFSLQHLPHLEQLDGVSITMEQRSLTVSVYAKKSIYYSMRGAILNGNVALMYKFAQQEAEKKRNFARDAIRRLDIQLMKLGEYGRDGQYVSRVVTAEEEAHRQTLKRARETREVELEGIERQLLEAWSRTTFETESLHERLLLELNSCGSIRLEEGSETDSWYVNAGELLTSRFDADLYEGMGVTGVKVNRVFRITCQGLRERFDNRIRELDVDLADTRNRRALIRLFSAIPRHAKDQRSFLYEVMTNGFPGLYAEDEGVPLTNSLFYADQERLLSLKRNRNIFGLTSQPDQLSAQLLVSRLFLGKCVAEMGGGRDTSLEEGGDKAVEQPFMTGRRKVTRRHYGDGVFSVYRASEHNPAVKVWHVFDKCLLLPEYVIDFTYTTKAHLTISPPLSMYDKRESLQALLDKVMPMGAQDAINDARTAGYPLLHFLHWLDSNAFHVYSSGETEKAISRAKELYQPKHGLMLINGPLTNELVDSYISNYGTLSDSMLTSCDISEKQIHCIPESLTTSAWGALKTLLLHHNKITTVAWEAIANAAPTLETLDLGNNEIARIDLGAASFPGLKKLCLSFNSCSAMDDLRQLPTKMPELCCLHIDHNPWMMNKVVEPFCVSIMPELQQLNGIAISRHARLSYLRKRTLMLNQSTLQYIVSEEQKLRAESATEAFPNSGCGNVLDDSSSSNNNNSDVFRSRYFEQVIANMADRVNQDRPFAPTAGKELSGPPLRSVRAFSFHSSLSSDIKWVTLLPQLRHLSLTSHLIEDISPLAQLRHLRTLNLNDNLVNSTKPLEGMRLISLDLSRNCLYEVDGIASLCDLRFLSIRQNFITSVTELQNCLSLEELYLADNNVPDVRELCLLQSLPKLVSMDAAGNLCAERENAEKLTEYRDCLLYNMPKLKVLDGLPVAEADQQRARDVFAGRVSADLLIERVGPVEMWGTAQEVDLSHCGLRELTLLDPFSCLRVLHLHHNNLERIDGLSSLTSIVALDLSHNRLGHCAVGRVLRNLPNIHSLSLEGNHITDVSALSLALPRLQFLNLKGNEISSIETGLQDLPALRELLLDNNKLRALGPDCFANNHQLTDVSADENYIRTIDGLQSLPRLSILSLGSNRLGDIRAIAQVLRHSGCLAAATFIGNAVARKPPYRVHMIAALPTLTTLDHREITDDERERAELMRNAEIGTPHNVVLDTTFPAEAVGGARASAPVGTLRSIVLHSHRFPAPATPRLQLPVCKNPRGEQHGREGVGKGFAPRLHGAR
ncbi:hypothetical protein, conserved [Trypanosoma brucei gambiense DAL972]|uniref:U2A'/phosphoprotein 32 family A C-terminal domain-containing protein n=1 Tax=Trypanosoma brucei gambiense (strain MHOM/CI/86/DAL972) TaxID=679716 RepID=D0A717_TRYB9|nr:hypothetical protein, conserved [Trypanosoma brucei gambiense DAL972]CBH17468.1 hypothetical protein, conserved [Trypanosoma brucei gambiense DAL972]|eukprot:XP_011779732.1 hypothetical protein, conserved [Trypanosoma brucei gambiense DAL972]